MRGLAIVAILAILGGCGDDDDGGGAVDAAISIDGAIAIDADPAAPDAGPGGTGAICGGIGGFQCADTHFCAHTDKSCGFDDGTGTCQPRPETCPDFVQLVCGCDGNVHSNACDANAIGVDVSQVGGCTAPANTFGCGELFCRDEVEYCQRQVSDIGGFADDFACRSMPLDCTECSCVADEPCGDMCSTDDAGNIVLTCPGG